MNRTRPTETQTLASLLSAASGLSERACRAMRVDGQAETLAPKTIGNVITLQIENPETAAPGGPRDDRGRGPAGSPVAPAGDLAPEEGGDNG